MKWLPGSSLLIMGGAVVAFFLLGFIPHPKSLAPFDPLLFTKALGLLQFSLPLFVAVTISVLNRQVVASHRSLFWRVFELIALAAMIVAVWLLIPAENENELAWAGFGLAPFFIIALLGSVVLIIRVKVAIRHAVPSIK